jgi:hypothetical protein
MVKYSKQHFNDVAKIISTLPINCRIMVSERFCHLFIESNPSFDVDKFVNACGLSDEVVIKEL